MDYAECGQSVVQEKVYEGRIKDVTELQ